MFLRSRVIDNDDGSVGRVMRAKGLGNDDGGISRRQGIRDASKGLETTTEAAGDRRRVQGIYDNDGGVEGGS